MSFSRIVPQRLKEMHCLYNLYSTFFRNIQYIVKKGNLHHNIMCYILQMQAFSFPSSISITP